MVDRLLSLLVAVCLALLVWLYSRSRDQEMLDNVPVPIQVVVNPAQAENYHLEMTGPAQVPVSFTGSPARIRELHGMIQRKELVAILTVTVPEERLSQDRVSDALQLEASDIHAPPGVTPLIPDGRNRIPYTLHRMVERRLPVQFDPQSDGLTGPVTIDPPAVLVRGPKEVLDRVRDIPTQPWVLPPRALTNRTAMGSAGRVPLVQELEGRPIRVSPSWVYVRATAGVRKTYELRDIPIRFLCPPGFALQPIFPDEKSGCLTLHLTGPVQDHLPKVSAFVDLTQEPCTSGLKREPLQLQLPKDFQVLEDPRRWVKFELKPGTIPAN
jgi:hypothetical protein